MAPSPSGPLLSRRQLCPFCSHVPLIFVSCGSCHSVFAWCGEEDYAVGVYDQTSLREIGLGETRDWARQRCPLCKATALGYSTKAQVESLGFAATDLYP
jgi:hypothetical protein